MTPTDEPSGRPPVRIISTLDLLGLRYLSVDVQVLQTLACWALPLAVAVRDDAAVPPAWTESRWLEPQLARAHAIDSQLPQLVVKTGQLLTREVVDRVAELVQDHASARLVLDPELFDHDGRARSGRDARLATARKLLCQADVAVGNRHDVAALTGREVEGLESMREAAQALFDAGAGVAIVTGAHLDGFPRDVFYDGTGFDELGDDRVPVEGTGRGAGGIFSTVLAAALARGRSPINAAACARKAASRALERRVWVTPTGLVPAAHLPAEDRPPGYWVANGQGAEAAL